MHVLALDEPDIGLPIIVQATPGFDDVAIAVGGG
jgi:hypothetical protein